MLASPTTVILAKAGTHPGNRSNVKETSRGEMGSGFRRNDELRGTAINATQVSAARWVAGTRPAMTKGG
jgi:hypothetical protein